MVRPKRAPNNIKKALTTGSQSTTTELNLIDEDSVAHQNKKSNKIHKFEEDDIKTKNEKNKAKSKAKNVETISEEILKEPRKRRMASLNAEFLVHYCSNNNPNLIQTPEKISSQSPSSSKRRRTLSNESKTKNINTRKHKTKKKEESEEIESESEENNRKVTTKKPQKKKVVRPKFKLEDVESENSENTENSVEKEHNRSKRSKRSDENLVLNSGRPKREASMRASAMIIQTNEIEKTRFQYYSSATTTPANILNTNTKKSEEVKDKVEKNEKNHNFQIPQPPKNAKNLKNTKKSESNLKHVSTTTTLANSQGANLGRNDSPDDEESSNDVLIVAEKTASNTELALSEEILAEHNKQFGSYTTGSGTFSNHTREYIDKWINQLVPPDDKPFPEEIIPIDTFGPKTLDAPQYLNVKSRQQQQQSTTTVKITKPVTNQVVKNGKESPQNVKTSSTSPKPQTKVETTNTTTKQNGKNDLDMLCINAATANKKNDNITNGFEIKAKQVLA